MYMWLCKVKIGTKKKIEANLTLSTTVEHDHIAPVHARARDAITNTRTHRWILSTNNAQCDIKMYE